MGSDSRNGAGLYARTARGRILAAVSIFCLAACIAVSAGNPANALVAAARSQIGQTVRYDPSYRPMDYPNGDVPMDRGVCTDVVIRAMRAAFDLDLQKLVHEDMTRDFAAYPNNWGLSRPDKHIDHRRVPNLRVFFDRQGWDLPVSRDPAAYRAGDLVTCIVPPGVPHIMIVSDTTNAHGIPLVIHNIGAGVQEEDRLFEFRLTGHYRNRR